jgi:two-component system, OmpR family, sensor kinase
VPIRLRLALSGIVVAGLALVLFGLLLDRLAAAAAPADQDTRLATQADRAVSSIRDAPAARLRSGLSPVLVDPGATTDSFVLVVTKTGRVLHGSARPAGILESIPRSALTRAARTGAAKETVTTADGLELRVHLRSWKRADLGLAGTVVAGQSTRFAEEQVLGARIFIILAGVIALIAAAIATWVVSGRALRPLKQLAVTTDEIGRTGDLSRRLPAARRQDVVGTLTTSFNAMLERLSGTLEAQRRFVADASHELRSPLTTIRSNAGFLLTHRDVDEGDRTEALGDIAAEGERMGRLIDDLLTLARADAGQPLERRPVDLGRLAEDVVRRSRRTARSIRLQRGPGAVVEGDPDALTRLLWILVDNAVRHGDGEIEVRSASQDGRAVLSVADRGGGVPEADLDRIFERFYRSDPARGGRGAGLGLSIARWIAEAHGGSIRAANRPDGGATFTVELPPA